MCCKASSSSPSPCRFLKSRVCCGAPAVGATREASPALSALPTICGMNPISFLTQMVRIAIPYLFAASGGVVAERSGIVSLTLEGFMLSGAFAAVLGTNYSGSPWVGVFSGIVGGLIFALIHAVATIRYRADQVVVGVAINLLAIGVTRFFLKLFFASSSNSPRVAGFGGNINAAGFDNPLLWLRPFLSPGGGVVVFPAPVWFCRGGAGWGPQ